MSEQRKFWVQCRAGCGETTRLEVSKEWTCEKCDPEKRKKVPDKPPKNIWAKAWGTLS